MLLTSIRMISLIKRDNRQKIHGTHNHKKSFAGVCVSCMIGA